MFITRFIILFVFISTFITCNKISNSNNCDSILIDSDFNNFTFDPYGLDSVNIEGLFLKINLSYGGGCETHYFELLSKHNMSNDSIILKLSHEANNDGCFALLFGEFCYNISSLIIPQNSKQFFFEYEDSLINLNY